MQLRNVLLVAGAASFSTRDVWDGYQSALRDAGLGVVPYPTFSMLRVISPELVGNDIIGKAFDHRNGIDAVVFIDGLYFQGRRQWVPKTLTDAGMTTILIATDDPYDEVADAGTIYTHYFTNEIESAGAKVRYLPTATCLPPDGPRGRAHEIVFIGTVFEERWPLLQQLARYCERRRIRCLIAGNMTTDVSEFADFDCVTVRNEVIPADAKWRLYRGAKLVLNIFRDSETPAQAPNPRVFEVTALGQPALLTGPNRSEVSRIFGDSVYHFTDFDSLVSQIELALGNEADRVDRVERAQRITLDGHLYEHRAKRLISLVDQCESSGQERGFPNEDRLCWIFGCGRTGSTWLGQMLGCIDDVFSWHEPMFGKLFGFARGKPSEYERPQSFFYADLALTWLAGMRETFLSMTRERYPAGSSQSGLFVKEVNAPELCPHVRQLFPRSKYLLLVRDPYDVLDSYLDMQRPGGWNEGFSGGETSLSGQAQIASNNIQRSLKLSLQAYEEFPESQRLLLRYEDLVNDPAQMLGVCARLVGMELSSQDAQTISQEHRFDNYSDTGRLSHRRYGRAGVWKESENFTAEVRDIADDLLGGLRKRLEYTD